MKYIRTPRPKRPKSSIPFRLNFLFFIVFLLFALLVGQLAYLQIANGSRFSDEVNSTGKTVVTGSVPRGLVYDSKGRILVNNKANAAITYTKSVAISAKTMFTTANLLQKYITVSTSTLQPRDYRDYYLASDKNTKRVNKHLTAKQLKKGETDSSYLYKLQLAVAKQIMPTLTGAQKQAAAIYKTMNGATQLSTVYIKNTGVTSKEVAIVGEHLTNLPGVNLGTDWERSYPNGTSMTSIIGRVSSEKSGLPKEALVSYLENGYARNDRVGTSYLEKQYEDSLRGSKSQTSVEINSSDEIVNQVQKYAGSQGQNLNLTIDSKFQNKVESIIKSVYGNALKSSGMGVSDGAYAVVMNPNTGAILAIAGEKHNFKTGGMEDDALGVINRAFVMGSAVKPAMILGALQDGVISTANNTQSDEPIYLKGAAVKKSVYPIGTFSSMTAQLALQVSSNIYVMRLAMKEANSTYAPKSVLTMNSDIFSKMRGYFSQFGLGNKTGVDLPGEVTGLTGANYNDLGQLDVGSALNLSFGNYDSYTLMQMGQYVSTIANGGYKMQPYIVQSISQTEADGSTGPVVSATQPTVQSKLLNTVNQVNYIKQGMWQAVHGTNGWTTATLLQDLNPGVAVKTGTAQGFTLSDPNNKKSDVVETLNVSIVGFAPAKNPQIAFAVVVPDIYESADNAGYQKQIANQIVQAYYKMYNVKEDKNYTKTQANISN